jgi:hypothetical protein
MAPLQAGVDSAVIALWLGHESVETTRIYLHAHLALKGAALAKISPSDVGKGGRYRQGDLPIDSLNALGRQDYAESDSFCCWRHDWNPRMPMALPSTHLAWFGTRHERRS